MFQPHFLIVSFGTTISVTQATHGLGKFPAARVVSPFEILPNDALNVRIERISPASRLRIDVSRSGLDEFVSDPGTVTRNQAVL